MNDSSSGLPFEYTVTEQNPLLLTARRVTLVAVYVLWAAMLLALGFSLQLPVSYFAIIPISLWPIVSFSWKRTKIEYEYSYFDGILTVARVRGGCSRRVLTRVSLKDFDAVYPCDEEYVARAEQYGAGKIIFAASSQNAESLCVALWKDERNVRYALYFEPNERAIRILRAGNYTATTALKKS